MTFEIKKQFTIDASTDRVWDILVDQFEDVADWATGVTTSVPRPETTVYPDGTSGGRVCEVIGFGATDERLVHYDREIGFERRSPHRRIRQRNWRPDRIACVIGAPALRELCLFG